MVFALLHLKVVAKRVNFNPVAALALDVLNTRPLHTIVPYAAGSIFFWYHEIAACTEPNFQLSLWYMYAQFCLYWRKSYW